jgi:hypothetical protein
MDFRVICDHAGECDKNKGCQYCEPYGPPAHTIDHGWCSQGNKHVNVIVYQEMDQDNPNFLYKRKKKYGH